VEGKKGKCGVDLVLISLTPELCSFAGANPKGEGEVE
jgi:hypothetical protein